MWRTPKGLLIKRGREWLPAPIELKNPVSICMNGTQYAKSIFTTSRKAELMALGFKELVYKKYNEKFYRKTGETEEETSPGVIGITPITEQGFTAIQLAQSMAEDIKTAVFAMIEDARLRVRFYKDMDPTNPLKAQWELWVTDLKTVWTGTIKPDLTTLAQADDYEGLIEYRWADKIPPQPEE